MLKRIFQESLGRALVGAAPAEIAIILDPLVLTGFVRVNGQVLDGGKDGCQPDPWTEAGRDQQTVQSPPAEAGLLGQGWIEGQAS